MDSLRAEQLKTIQGDIWRKGFPKFNETYYFFTILPGQDKRKLFSQNLRTVASKLLISDLTKVIEDQNNVKTHKLAWDAKQQAGSPKKEMEEKERLPVSNALIAFTYQGLLAIQDGFANNTSLALADVSKTDPAFCKGMEDQDNKKKLGDPAYDDSWDPVFNPKVQIHGLLKIAGSTHKDVDDKLKLIVKTLGRGSVIVDATVPLTDPYPQTISSRIDGWTRPNHRGKEHFGFEDGISQPLLHPIDDDVKVTTAVNMFTNVGIIIVNKRTKKEALDTTKHPEWMIDGSFLAFRKLEQDVKAFDDLTDKHKDYGCSTKELMGAKLMGRWKSGAPINDQNYHTADETTNLDSVKEANDFVYNGTECPIGAHIRKTNPRTKSDGNGDERDPRARIIRAGIPYGPDYQKNSNDISKRGLLFACYQAHVEDGFRHQQHHWSNNPDFSFGKPGLDPIIGQSTKRETPGENDVTVPMEMFFDGDEKKNVRVPLPKWVNYKGGEYFFVPSIPALEQYLGQG